MNIVTVIDENWLGWQLQRFVNMANRAMPREHYIKQHDLMVSIHDYYLVVVYSTAESLKNIKKQEVIGFFKKVSYVQKDDSQPGYMQYNALRFSLLKRFKLKECLYTDADVDVFKDLSPIAKESDAPLIWMRSPCEINGMAGPLQLVGCDGTHNDETPHANAGMLYMRRDFKKEYDEACAKVAATDFTPRMIGNAAFNVMVRSMRPKLQHKAPYKYDVIWWDSGKLATAFAVHYCNDQGKAKWEHLARTWVS